MSMFDPYQLYSHPQRKSHKGQVIQKKATEGPYAITQRELERALAVVQTYGYNLYPPGISKSFLGIPFFININNVDLQEFTVTASYLWAGLNQLNQTLSSFVSNHPIADTSHVLIGIASLATFFYSGTDTTITCYNEGTVATLRPNFNFASDGSTVSIVLGPAGSSNYYLTFDAYYGSSAKSGETTMYNRTVESNPSGLLNYCTITNKWQELITGILDPDPVLFTTTSGVGSYLKSVTIQGMIVIELN